MSKPKHRREAAFRARKQDQHPHGKIPSYEELAEETHPELPRTAHPKDYEEIEY